MQPFLSIIPFYTEQPCYSYERKINSRFSIKLSYSFWNGFSPKWQAEGMPGFIMPNAMGLLKKGFLYARFGYSMADFVYMHKIYKSKKQAIYFDFCITYTHGHNNYVDTTIFLPTNISGYSPKNGQTENLFGFIPAIEYNYSILKNVLKIGLEIKYRKYFMIYTSQFDYGWNLTCNF